MASADIILVVLQTIMKIWDFLTYPIYQMMQKPWEKVRMIEKTFAKPVKTSDQEIVFEAAEKQRALFDDMLRAKCDTMDKAWRWSVSKYGSRSLLGTRDILAEEDEVQPNGKIFKKFSLGDYRWISYEGVDTTADHFGKGLRDLGMNYQDKVCVFADTRNEWFIAAQACFKQSFALVTLYTNLGEEAVEHGVNQTKVAHIITSHDLLPKFRSILKNTPTVTKVIYFEDQVKSTDTSGFPDNVEIIPFWDVVSRGKKLVDDPQVQPSPPSPSDTAIVMYTSGSTGVPKGVVLSHKNMFSTLKSVMLSIDIQATKEDTFIAFLPLAHVLELLCESMMCMFGVKIGYSTPNTLIDKSSMVKRGSMGDATILQPTIMAAVPLILDRVYKSITEAVAKKGPGFERIFKYCYDYRMKAINRGETTPILDALLFRNFRALFGGRLKLIVAGGAPLSKETHDFIRNCMGCPVLQGYGLTETTACASLMEMCEMSTEAVGPPNQGVQIKLINWEEGNYRVTDQPRPRGEIVIGGNTVADGYYLMPEKTAEDFYEANGRRWFKTGDVGQFERNGTLKIIDRKKDLVKLQFGEYVSLGKVEACLKTCPIVDNVCIYGESTKSYTVALVVPDQAQLKVLAKKFGKDSLSHEELCEDRDVTGGVLRELVNHGKKHKLEKFEIPGAVSLCKELWAPESGLVTAAFKLKRKPIQEFYQRDLDRMYGASSGK